MNNEIFNLKKWVDTAFRIFINTLYYKSIPMITAPTSEYLTSVDIEEAHSKSCHENNMFYTDPSTSLSVLTESAHLKRGKCCGNMCRHCPYGWEKVRSLSKLPIVEIHEKYVSENNGIGRKIGGFIKSGDTIKCASELALWKTPNVEDIDFSVPFTKGGDEGTSGLPTGERLSKTSDCFVVIGSVDELCSFVGLTHSMLIERNDTIGDMENLLFDIIQKLFDIGAVIATKGSGEFVSKGHLMTFSSSNTDELETYITKQTITILPELNNFILPTGSPLSSQLHVCRSVCRRVERDYVRYLEGRNSNKFESDSISVYLNRLSDFFFTASRVINLLDKTSNPKMFGRGDVIFVGSGEGGLDRIVEYE